MGIVDIFSKRQRRLRREIPDVYQYADLPITFRRQVVFILRDVLENDGRLNVLPTKRTNASRLFMTSWPASLGSSSFMSTLAIPQEGVLVTSFVLNTGNVEKVLSVIELSLRLARQVTAGTLGGVAPR